MANQTASFWKYQGNANGRNCERKDPHGFGLDLIAYLEYCDRSGDFQTPLTYTDIEDIKVIRHKKGSTSFGQEITVKAPAQVWAKAKEALANMAAEGY